MRIEDAFGWFVTLDDAVRMQTKGLMRLESHTAEMLPEKLQKLSFIAFILDRVDEIRDGWDRLLSIPYDMQNDDGSIRVPSRYERFLDDYEDL